MDTKNQLKNTLQNMIPKKGRYAHVSEDLFLCFVIITQHESVSTMLDRKSHVSE